MGFTQNTGGSKIRSQVWLKGVGAVMMIWAPSSEPRVGFAEELARSWIPSDGWRSRIRCSLCSKKQSQVCTN